MMFLCELIGNVWKKNHGSYFIEKKTMCNNIMILQQYMDEHITGNRRDRLTVLSTVIFFLVGNGYAFLNYSPIHDAIPFMLTKFNVWQVQLGRFLIPLYLRIRGDIAAPFVICVLSIIYLSLGLCCIVRILNFNTKSSIILACGFLCVNPFTFEICAIHQYFADVFLLAFSFSCFAVYLLQEESILKNRVCSILCFFISFGIYPAFITFALCLIVLSFLREIVEQKKNGVYTRLVVKLCSLFLAGVAYVIVSRGSLKVLNISAASANWSIFSVGRLSPVEVLHSIKNNYRWFCDLFFSKQSFLGMAVSISTIGLLLTGTFIIVYAARKQIGNIFILFIVFLMLLFPFGSRLVNIMTEANNAYRTMYAQFLIWPISIWLIYNGRNAIKKRPRIIIWYCTMLLSFIIILSNVKYNNGGFVYKNILYNRAEYHTGQVLEDLKKLTIGKMDVPIAVVGVFDFDTRIPSFYDKYTYIGGMSKDTGITYEEVFGSMAELMGIDLNWSSNYSNAVRNTKQVKEMPCYPQTGYISEVDDYLVIKLSN